MSTALRIAEANSLNAALARRDADEARAEAIEQAAEEIFDALNEHGEFAYGELFICRHDVVAEIYDVLGNEPVKHGESGLGPRCDWIRACESAYSKAINRLADKYAERYLDLQIDASREPE